MRKFLLPMAVAFVLLISSVQAQAADVPEFLSVVGNKATYVGGQQIRDKSGNYDTYAYECNDIRLGEDLAVAYCNYLITNCPFQLVGGFENDYTQTSTKSFTQALFKYTGSKNVNTFIIEDYQRKRQYNCNVNVLTNAQYQTGTMKIVIYVATALTYG